MKKNELKVLDCTLRDGGYYNNWNFSIQLINKYLKVMSDIKVDYVEIGFRSMEKKEFSEEKLNLYLTRASEGCHSIFEKVEQLKQLKDQDIDEIHDGLRFKKTS